MIWGTDSKRAGRKWSSSGLPCCRQNDLIPLGRVNRMTAGVEEIIELFHPNFNARMFVARGILGTLGGGHSK